MTQNLSELELQKKPRGRQLQKRGRHHTHPDSMVKVERLLQQAVLWPLLGRHFPLKLPRLLFQQLFFQRRDFLIHLGNKTAVILKCCIY